MLSLSNWRMLKALASKKATVAHYIFREEKNHIK